MEWRIRRSFVANFFRASVLVAIAFVTFLVLIFPAHSRTSTVSEIHGAKRAGYKSLTKPQRTADGTVYSWTNPQSQLYFFNVNRVVPLKVTMIMDITAAKADPKAGEVAVNELKSDDGKSVRLANWKVEQASSGFSEYSFTVPPDLEADTVIGLELTSPAVTVAGLPNSKGVQLSELRVEIASSPYLYLLWPRPYLLAVLVLLTGLTYWCSRAGLDWLETALLLLPFSLMAAALMQFLVVWSWLLLALAGLVMVMAASWGRNYSWNWKQLKLIKAATPHNLLLPILVAALALGLFMITAPSFIFDTRLFLGWNHKVHLYGPFNIYRHVADLDYPPLIVYVLWIYGWVLAPFNLTDNLLAFKVFMLLCALGVGVIIWRIGRPKFETMPNLSKALVVVSFSAALLFNPAVWGQVDGLLGLLMLLAFWLIYRQRPLWAGGWLGILLLFKPQAWVLLPLLTVLIIKKAGWKRGLWSGLIGLVLTLALAIPAFGGDFNAFLKFWSQPSLAGTAAKEAETGSLGAFNLLWLLGFDSKAASSEITWLGFGLIALIYGLVLIRTILKGAVESEISLGAAVLMVVFFFLSIKMRERYLYYSLPLLGWACLYNPKVTKPFLVVNLLCLVNTLHGYLKNNHHPPPTSFYIWPDTIQPILFSWLTLLVTLYLVWIYLQSSISDFKQWRGRVPNLKTRPNSKPLSAPATK